MTDQERIQGTWSLESGERQGQAFPAEMARDVSLIFSGDGLTTKTKAGAFEARFKLIPDTDPKGIDLDMGDAVGLGIYVLDGDNLKIAHGEVGNPRPTTFSAKEGSNLTILVMKRVSL